MTSQKKLHANRNNARASTGPKTVKGKERASQNARSHGLSVPVLNDQILCEEVEELARRAANENADAVIRRSAFKFAEAQVTIARIRRVRRDLLVYPLTDRRYEPARTRGEEGRRAKWLLYFSEIFAQNLQRPPDTAGNLADLIGPTPFSEVAADIAKRIAALDRYERRALSRRKSAIRDLDAARSQERQTATKTPP